MNEQKRTATDYEILILTWMNNHTDKISTNKVRLVFGINKPEAERMIGIHKLNPGSDFETIRTQ